MRLVRTQANTTKKYLQRGQDIVLEAIKTKNFKDLQYKLEKELSLIPAYAMQIVNELAIYENQFTTKKLEKYSTTPIKKLSVEQVKEATPDIKISTTIGKPAQTILNTYKSFADTKAKQYVQIVDDAQVEGLDDSELEDIVAERTDGLFTTQNMALAALAIVGTSNSIRNDLADENLLEVDWVLDLELNNCPYCQDMADGGPYNPLDVDGLIPAHANCGCTLIPILDALDNGDGSDLSE